MPSPPIQLFLTTIASQVVLRQRQEYILRTLQVKKIPFTSYDLASNEDAKRLWKRKAPLDKQQLPGILVGGRFPGTFSDFEEAVEYDELSTFLRLNEEYDPEVEEDGPALAAPAVGVPGVSTPQQMTNKQLAVTPSPSASPLGNKGGKRPNEFDIGEKLPGFGLQGLNVTDGDIADLVKELGLEGDAAGELVKGLSSTNQDASEDKHGETKKDDISPDDQVEDKQKEQMVLGEEKKLQVQDSETGS